MSEIQVSVQYYDSESGRVYGAQRVMTTEEIERNVFLSGDPEMAVADAAVFAFREVQTNLETND